MKLLVQFSTMLLLVFSMISCDKDDKITPNTIFKATLNGTSEVPSNASAATGTATLTFNPNTKVATMSVSHNLAAATAGHIHKAAAGSNGDVVFPLASITSPINFTSIPFTASQESDLNAGLFYVNLHTASFPGGEIRGQLIRQ